MTRQDGTPGAGDVTSTSSTPPAASTAPGQPAGQSAGDQSTTDSQPAGFDLSRENRFGGLGRLVGPAGLEALGTKTVLVAGLGGVGSWAAEALARSGLGGLVLVDLDDSCVTNTNRQLHALDGAYGQPKATLLAERFRLINPAMQLRVITDFVTPRNVDRLIVPGIDFVIDATDSVPDKAAMYLRCRTAGIPLAISGASGGRTDPTRLVWSDLGQEEGDPLLKSLKRWLRRNHAFQPGRAAGSAGSHREHWGAWCVWSREPAVLPWEQCGLDGQPSQPAGRIDCASGFGAASFLTGSFGFALASLAVRHLAGTLSA